MSQNGRRDYDLPPRPARDTRRVDALSILRIYNAFPRLTNSNPIPPTGCEALYAARSFSSSASYCKSVTRMARRPAGPGGSVRACRSIRWPNLGAISSRCVTAHTHVCLGAMGSRCVTPRAQAVREDSRCEVSGIALRIPGPPAATPLCLPRDARIGSLHASTIYWQSHFSHFLYSFAAETVRTIAAPLSSAFWYGQPQMQYSASRGRCARALLWCLAPFST